MYTLHCAGRFASSAADIALSIDRVLGVHSAKKVRMSIAIRVPVAPHTSRSDTLFSSTSRKILNPKLSHDGNNNCNNNISNVNKDEYICVYDNAVVYSKYYLAYSLTRISCISSLSLTANSSVRSQPCARAHASAHVPKMKLAPGPSTVQFLRLYPIFCLLFLTWIVSN